MTIARITYRNFQKHRRRVLGLSPTVTVLCGPSDRGKSSCLRGLRWLALNKPDGGSFIRHGAKFCKVGAEVDGHQVTRRWGKGGNSYYLDGNRYVSFGKGGVPDDISALLNLGDVNFARQHDPVWWFSKTPGEVSRELNSIVNLGLIDRALANAASAVRSAHAREAECKARLKAARVARDELAWVPEAYTKLQATESLRMAAEEKRRTAILGRSLLAGVAKATREASDAVNGLLGASKGVAAAEKALEARREADRIHYLLSSVGKHSAEAETPLPPPGELARLEGLAREVVESRGRAARLKGMLAEVGAARKELSEAEAGHVEAVGDLVENMKGACPVCGRLMG